MCACKRIHIVCVCESMCVCVYSLFLFLTVLPALNYLPSSHFPILPLYLFPSHYLEMLRLNLFILNFPRHFLCLKLIISFNSKCFIPDVYVSNVHNCKVSILWLTKYNSEASLFLFINSYFRLCWVNFSYVWYLYLILHCFM